MVGTGVECGRGVDSHARLVGGFVIADVVYAKGDRLFVYVISIDV